MNLFAFPLQSFVKTELACNAMPRRETRCRTRGCLPLSIFTAFGLFFDNARSFLAYNRFVVMALSVSCDNVFTKNRRLRCLVQDS
jgi:hypothetical protein